MSNLLILLVFLTMTIVALGQEHEQSKFLFYFKKAFDYLNQAEQENGSCEASKLANFYAAKIIYDIPHCQNKKVLAIAHKILADSFYSGDGTDKIPLMALHHYRQSARMGYPPGQFNVAVVYHEIGDTQKALYWMREYQKNKNAPLRDYAQKIVQKWQREKPITASDE